jgi:hypothetical protein
MDMAIQRHGMEGWTGEGFEGEEGSDSDGDAPLEIYGAAEEEADAEDRA